MPRALVRALLAFSITACVTGTGAGAIAALGAQQLLAPTPAEEEASKYIAQYLLQNHYRKVPANDSLSQQVFDRFLENLDPNRSYFTAPEVVNLRKEMGRKLDDEFVMGKTTSGFRIYNLFLQRAKEKMSFMIAALKGPALQFSNHETMMADRKDAPWPSDRNELHDLWNKELKYQFLNLKASGDKDTTIVSTLVKSYTNRRKLLDQQKPDDAYQAYTYALTTSFDPHTSYFSPEEYENFQIDMSRSLEGIGAKLQMENEYTVVNEIIPGGPAFKSNQLKKGDRIVGVGQGTSGEIVDVTGWRLSDVVKLIRGAKGSVVRLRILPATQANKGPARVISLVRARVDLQEQAAQKKIINRDGHRIGVITIPSFYLDFEGQRQHKAEYASTTRDVKKIIEELKRSNVEGIIVDLRENGGGSLEEAVNVTGLFIPSGPVVQVSNAMGGKMVLSDEDARVQYDGPLEVLVNRYSASASEIFAAAIQDYGRGLIIGERTFGKGTVQSIVTLQRPFGIFAEKDTDLGQLKLTIAKFYRISGGSTQHIGVVPDIVLPSMVDPEVVGEDTYTSSMPWTTISKASYDYEGLVTKDDIALLKQKYGEQTSKDRIFQEYIRDIDELNSIRKRNVVTLSEAAIKSESQTLKRIQERWGDGDGEKKKKKTDFILDQAAGVMTDLIPLLKSPSQSTRMAG